MHEWMERLTIAAKECNYQGLDRQIKEQFVHGTNDDYMVIEICSEPEAIKIQAKLQVIRFLCGQVE